MSEPLDLGPLEEFDDEKSIDMQEARKLMRGRAGRASLEVVRRWANPCRGCRPRGEAGPVLVLPAVKVSGGWRTMASWVAAFERERQRQGMGTRVFPQESRTPKQAAAGHRRATAFLEAEGVIKPVSPKG